ncbi:DUF3822 family protein [Hymenobacter sp. J193]|uniref:DUF3822 family protein n=1 Tax=Hymenobacter sp. J193 TaxID=2898429 RepID=UPI002151A073|nr:DUF3822 family protein [Hymenobacter sp. J193]MCR5889290.1 DUF3822 family protein [Hymenobacter sp. J193]
MSDSASTAAALAALPSLRDETLDPDQLAAYNLYLSAGAAGLRVGVADARRNKFLLLEDYAPQPATPLAEQLQILTAQHDLVGQPGWNQVRLSVHNRHFTLLPAPLFREGDEDTYLRLHHRADAAREVVRSYRHAGRDIVSVFAAERDVAEWFGRLYPTGKLLHHTSALLEGLVHQSDRGAPRRLYVSISQQEVTLLVVRDKQPEFCNVFAFSTPEDLIYYIILVMQEMQLNPDQDPVLVWGDLLHDSALFTILRKYIRNIRFGNRPYDLGYSYRLNDVFEYRYFDLFSLHLC